MAHHYSRRVFGQARTITPLLECYTSLVAIELTLKDELNSINGKHDVVMLTATFLGKFPNSPRALRTQINNIEKAKADLERRLKHIHFTGSKGQPDSDAKQYPNLRYIHHVSEWPGTTTDTQLTELRTAVRSLRRELDKFLKLQQKNQVVPS